MSIYNKNTMTAVIVENEDNLEVPRICNDFFIKNYYSYFFTYPP